MRWYFSTLSRRESERLLEFLENERGTYLIRDSNQGTGKFSLSILDYTTQKQRHTKHYLIERNDYGDYFIKKSKPFKTMDDLIRYYSGNQFIRIIFEMNFEFKIIIFF